MKNTGQVLVGLALSLLVILFMPTKGEGNGNVLSVIFKPRTVTIEQVRSKLVTSNAGYVDAVKKIDNDFLVSGWAADVAAKTPVKAVHIFIDEHLVATLVPHARRPDVAASLGIPGLLHSGFGASPSIPLGAADAVQVFAEFNDGSFSQLSSAAITFAKPWEAE